MSTQIKSSFFFILFFAALFVANPFTANAQITLPKIKKPNIENIGKDAKKVFGQGKEAARKWDVNAGEALPLAAVDSVFLPDGRTLVVTPPATLPATTSDSFALALPYTGGQLLLKAMRTGDTLRYAFSNGGKLDTLTFANGGAVAIADMKYLRNEEACTKAGNPERWISASNGIAIHVAKPWEMAAAAKAKAEQAKAKAQAAPTGKVGGKPTATKPAATVPANVSAKADTLTTAGANAKAKLQGKSAATVPATKADTVATKPVVAVPAGALKPADIATLKVTLANGTATSHTITKATEANGVWRLESRSGSILSLTVVSADKLKYGTSGAEFVRQPNGSYKCADGRTFEVTMKQ